MHWRRHMVLAGGALLGATLAAAVAVAQESSRDGVVLHEYFDPSTVSVGGAAGPRAGTSAPRRTAQSAGEPPGLTLDPGAGDSVLGPDGPLEQDRRRSPYGPSSPRAGFTQLDAKTNRVDDLDYFASFDPSVFPYKRNVVQNRIVRTDAGEYRTVTASDEYDRVPVAGGQAAPDEDTFWGTFLIRAQPSGKHPIPSVAPRQRVLAVQTEPEVDARVYRDAADNYFLEIDHRGLVRVNMEIAAPRFYFDGRFDDRIAWTAFEERATPTFDPAIEPVAQRVLEQVGVTRDMTPSKVVRRLVYYFRDFETKSLPDGASQGDLYETIATRQIGVCRHRSMAFVVTAQALGIPARYVTNEAHAFVELYWPTEGWRRIDLGGAARDISYNGDRGDHLHDGALRDPLPKPPAYRAELREMRERSSSESSGPSNPDSERAGSSGGSGGPGRNPTTGEGTDAGSTGERTSHRRVDAGRGREENRREASIDEVVPEEARAAEEASAERRAESSQSPTQLSLRTGSRTVFRGGKVSVHGRLVSGSNRPVANKSIRIYFGRVGARPENMRKLGTTKTDEAGRYRARVTIPETTGIGRWALVAVFPGDEEFARARAE